MIEQNLLSENEITQTKKSTMTPEEFELTVFSYLSEIGSELDNFIIEHNVKEFAQDGTYQIDVRAEFEAMGTKIKVLVECKNYKSPINREKVQILKEKLNSIGAHKGILFSTSSFQSGCIEFAEKHGIALVHMIDGKSNYKTKSLDKTNVNIPESDEFVGEYIYNKNGDTYSTYFIQKGYIDGLKEFILK